MFSSLSDKLQQTFKRLRGKGHLSERDIDEAMREVRLALLEADVSFKVVKDFIARVKEKALGQDVMASLTPAQMVVKIVNDELTELMGGTQSKIANASRPPTIVLMVGLQGSGKTTHSAKLANWMRKQGKRPLLVAADIYRPAAIKQLQVLGGQLSIPVFTMEEGTKPPAIAKGAVEHAVKYGHDLVIVDTAGRLHVDDELMQELVDMKTIVRPHEILLVVDAMTGQDAVTVAEHFNSKLGIDGVVLTKLDGDARGGAALSVKAVTGKPIKFVGLGEKLDTLEPFHPERLASRILGMGDVLTLIEKAQTSMDEDDAKKMAEKLRTADFNLEDFMVQMRQVRKLGSVKDLLSLIPGVGSKLKDIEIDEQQFVRVEAIIQSMTKKERSSPRIIDGSRRKRIAKGAAVKVQDVNSLLTRFEEMKKVMKQLGGADRGGKGLMPGLPGLPKSPFKPRR